MTIATLTDGVRWRLYLPTQPGSWRERRFFTIHLFEQAPQDVATNLRRYLSKTSVLDGTALKEALAIHESRAKERQIREALLAAWRKICEEPDARLIELLSEQVESRCGHTPDPQVLAEFIVRTLASWPPPPPPDETDWTFRKPRSYTFRGQQHAVSTFKDILVGLCTTLHDEDPLGFWSRVRNLRSTRGRHYYTRDPRSLQAPRQIGRSGIYVETCFNANDVKARCHELLKAFGFPPESLRVGLRAGGS